MLPQATLDQAEALLAEVQGIGLTLATAESCTGGLVAAALTAIPGSSASVLGGLVTYSNEQKMALLGVPEGVLATVGAVSEACARHMAEGARMATGADIAVSTTGIAGPGGATADKPVGLVFIATARQGQPTRVQRFVFPGDRAAVRAATVAAALDAIQTIARA